MAIQINKPNSRINSADIERFEAMIGKKLPTDYLQFLLTFNGGKPESNEFPIPNQKNAACEYVCVKLLLAYWKNGNGEICVFGAQNSLIAFPKMFCQLAMLLAGMLFCLSLQPKKFGQLFFWDHELEANEGEPATFSNLFLIGNSFNDFFSKLNKFDTSQVFLKPGQVKRVAGQSKF